MTEYILGYSQIKLIELGLSLEEVFMLNYFIRFKNTNSMKEVIIDGKAYYWLYYQKILDDLPFLNIKTRRTLYNRFERLVSSGVLEKKVVKNKQGTRTYFRTSINYEALMKTSKVYKEKQEELKTVDPIPYKEIIDYLNKATGSSYKHRTESHRSKIRTRWNEGFTLEEFKQVIDFKKEDWAGKSWMYNEKLQIGDDLLKPDTLFGGKMDGYLVASKKGRVNENNKGYESVLEAKD